MAYVPVPKDLSKVKTKVAFNLTKRQIVCFAVALLLGLIFYGNVVLPFVDRFPKDTELYRVMTTKPEEVGEA